MTNRHLGRLALFPLWATILFFSLYLIVDLIRDRSEAAQFAERVATSYVRLVEEHASATLERTQRLLEDSVGLVNRSGRDAAVLEPALAAMQAKTPGVVSMSVTDADGIVFANTVGTPPGGSLADRSYFLALKAQGVDAPVVSELIKGRISRKWGIQVARALRGADGRFTGMVVANVGMSEYFAPFYESLTLAPGMAISLWDLDGRLLVRYPIREDSIGQVLQLPTVSGPLAQGRNSGVGSAVSPIDGQERLIAYRKLRDADIVALVALSEADYLAGWKAGLERAIFAILLISCGGLVASVMSLRNRAVEREALRNSKKLALALKAAGAGSWHWDTRSGAMEWSHEQSAIYGGAAPPANYDEWLALVVEEDRQRIADGMAQVVEARQSAFRNEFRVRGPDGQLRWLASLGTLHYDRNGTPIAAEGVNIDISAAKTAEAALEAARDQALAAQAHAEQASIARSRFLAAASHDLRQPVQSLLLLIEVIRVATAGTPLERVAVQMDQSLDALRMLLNSLLDISKLDAGVLQPELQEVNLGELLGRLGEEYSLRAGEQGLGFKAVLPQARIVTDPTLLERVLRNLLENALRYTTAGKVLIGCRHVGGALRIDIIDTGIGIPADQIEAIFDEFHQVGNSNRDRSMGLGLGLAIVRRLADMLGCGLDVASREGRGSRFSLLLPITHYIGVN